MGRDLNAILDYIAQLNELDVANVQPLAQISEVVLEMTPDVAVAQVGETTLRDDTPVPCLERAPVMSCRQNEKGLWQALQPSTPLTYPIDTHSARLVCVQPIVQDSAESLLWEACEIIKAEYPEKNWPSIIARAKKFLVVE